MIIEEPSFRPFPNVDYVIKEDLITPDMVNAGMQEAYRWARLTGNQAVECVDAEFMVNVFEAMLRAAPIARTMKE